MAKNTHTHIVHHHTAGQSGMTVSQAAPIIDEVHREKWGFIGTLGYYIGYHYLVDKFGGVLQVRSDTDIGAHCDADNMNYQGLGIACIGNFEEEEVTPEMKQALIDLDLSLVNKYKIPKENISYHAQHKQTKCCGHNLIMSLKDILDQIYDEDNLSKWEQEALQWANDADVISKPEESPFTIKETSWIAEKDRKLALHILSLWNKQQ